MSYAQVPNNKFCYRPYCEKPSTFNSPKLKSDSCPSGNDGAIDLSEYSDRMAQAMAIRDGCPDERAKLQTPLERPLCPPDPTLQGRDLPTCEGTPSEAVVDTNDTACMDRGEPSSGVSPTPVRPICLPPHAFTDGSRTQACRECGGPDNGQNSPQGHACLPPQAFSDAQAYMKRGTPGDGQSLIHPPPTETIEDDRPPRITECKEPPFSNVAPMDLPGTCRSAESNDPGEVRCCIKKCEISPEIFQKKPGVNRPPDGPLTSEYYKTKQLPYRFDNASGFNGYGCQQKPPVHPFYRTTSQEYGWFRPTIHTVPTSFFPQDQKFSKQQSVGGRYRNTSLDTAMAEKLVED